MLGTELGKSNFQPDYSQTSHSSFSGISNLGENISKLPILLFLLYTMSLLVLALVSILVGLGLGLCQTIYNVFFHPLRKFPGPALAGASSWWKVYKEVVKQETMANLLFDLHRQYGRQRRSGLLECPRVVCIGAKISNRRYRPSCPQRSKHIPSFSTQCGLGRPAA